LNFSKFGYSGNALWNVSKVLSVIVVALGVAYVVLSYRVIRRGSESDKKIFAIMFNGVR
jgi:hypothetical protein